MLSVSKTGTCFVNAKVGLKHSEYYIFSDVKATIDGTIQAEIYKKYPQADVQFRHCRGLCSYYAEKGGILIGCEC